MHRALDAQAGYGAGPVAAAAFVAMVGVIAIAQRVGASVRPGVELQADTPSLARSIRGIAGYDNDLYS